jgi:hypothetical protein
MTTESGRFTHRGAQLLTPKPQGPETVLSIGRRVRMLADCQSLRRGMEGVVHTVTAWEGSSQVLVAFSFRNGDTMFNLHPIEMLGLLEVLP